MLSDFTTELIRHNQAVISDQQLLSIEKALQTALDHVQASRWREAENLCRQVLESDPINMDALHLLISATKQLGNPASADELIEKAIRCPEGKSI